MQIKFKKLRPEAVTPKRGTPGSAGFDLTATYIRKDCGEDFCIGILPVLPLKYQPDM